MLRGNRHAEIADMPTSKMNHALHELLLAMWRWNFRENLSTRRDMAKKEIKYLLEMTLPNGAPAVNIWCREFDTAITGDTIS